MRADWKVMLVPLRGPSLTSACFATCLLGAEKVLGKGLFGGNWVRMMKGMRRGSQGEACLEMPGTFGGAVCRHKTWKDGRKANVISEMMAPQLEALLILVLENEARCEAKEKEIREAAAAGERQELNHVKRICTTKVATNCNGHWNQAALVRCISLVGDIKAGRESERGERLENEFLERACGGPTHGRQGGLRMLGSRARTMRCA